MPCGAGDQIFPGYQFGQRHAGDHQDEQDGEALGHQQHRGAAADVAGGQRPHAEQHDPGQREGSPIR